MVTIHQYIDYAVGFVETLFNYFLIPFVLAPLGVIVSVVYTSHQKVWLPYLIAGTLGGTLNGIAAAYEIGEATFFGPLLATVVGMSMGIGFLFCLKLPREVRCAAQCGAAIGLIIAIATYHIEAHNIIGNMNPSVVDQNLQRLAWDCMVEAVYYSLIGSLFGAWIDGLRTARRA